MQHKQPIVERKFLAFFGITLICFVSFLEYTVVNTALPTIQDIFKVSVLDLQWVFNVYSIVVATAMIVCGRLGDRFGRRLVFYLGALALALGSLGAGIAWGFWWLVGFRVLQSIGVGACVTLSVGLIQDVFANNMHRPLSIYGAVTGIGLAIGPTVGGWIVQHWGWRWIFLINIPLLGAAFLLCAISLPEFKPTSKTKIDYIGAGLTAVMIFMLVYGLLRGGQYGWHELWTLVLLVGFAILLPLFIWYECRQDHPMMNFRFYRYPSYLLSLLGVATGGTVVAATLFFAPLFLQRVLGYSPVDAGYALLAVPIGVVVFAPFVGDIAKKIGVHWLLVATCVIGLLTALMNLSFGTHVALWWVVASFLLPGIGWALINVGTPIAAATSVPPEQAGSAVGNCFAIWNITSAVNIAVMSVLFHHASGGQSMNLSPLIFMKAYHSVFIYASIVMIVIVVLSLWALVAYRRRMRTLRT